MTKKKLDQFNFVCNVHVCLFHHFHLSRYFWPHFITSHHRWSLLIIRLLKYFHVVQCIDVFNHNYSQSFFPLLSNVSQYKFCVANINKRYVVWKIDWIIPVKWSLKIINDWYMSVVILSCLISIIIIIYYNY